MARHAIRNPLLLPELFHHILDHIDVPNRVEIGREHYIRVREPSTAARKALFALARTCRAISEPSLDRLWRELGSLVPLICCFAQVVDVDRAKTSPSPAEWTIIRRYAVRVRELCITGEPESMLSLYFIQSATSSQPLWLLPNLRVLVWDPTPTPDGFTPLIEKLLVPGLVSLNINLQEVGCLPHRLFGRYAALCPNLRALRWNFGPDTYYDSTPRATRVLSDSIFDLRKIDSLTLCVPLDTIPLKRVILSPDYKVLATVLDLLQTHQVDITPADTPFPNAETLQLDTWDLDFLTSLLRPHRQMLRTIVFTLHSEGAQPLVQSILSCFTALATPQRINSVQSIDFRLVLEYGPEHAQPHAPMSYCITYKTLSPLASFRCLRKLNIRLENQISIDDDELATLASSWPLLEALGLDCRSEGWPAKSVTLRGLLALIAACPKLYQLCFPIDARIVPMDASPDIRNTAIYFIKFPDSPISQPRLVANFFRKHLPRVTFVQADWSTRPGGDIVYYIRECERMWSEVEGLLRYTYILPAMCG